MGNNPQMRKRGVVVPLLFVFLFLEPSWVCVAQSSEVAGVQKSVKCSRGKHESKLFGYLPAFVQDSITNIFHGQTLVWPPTNFTSSPQTLVVIKSLLSKVI